VIRMLIIPLIEALVVYALVQGLTHTSWLSGIFAIVTFFIAFIIGAIQEMIHGEVEYTQDRADERSELLSAMSRKGSRKVYVDGRTVINDSRQVNITNNSTKGESHGKEQRNRISTSV